MKILALTLLAGSALMACQTIPRPAEDTDPEQTSPNPTVELAFQRPVTLPGAFGVAQATLTTVQDSRCPSDMTCVWAGVADVTVALTDATATVQTVRLSLTSTSPARDSVAITLNQRPYWLRLMTVSPYPSNATASQPKVATLRLRLR